jgi:hypothetical protein
MTTQQGQLEDLADRGMRARARVSGEGSAGAGAVGDRPRFGM